MAEIVSFKGNTVEPPKPVVSKPAKQLLQEVIEGIDKGEYENGQILLFVPDPGTKGLTLICNVLSKDPVEKLNAISLMARAKRNIITILTDYEIDSHT